MSEPEANNIYIFDAKAHGQDVAENARLKEENARLMQEIAEMRIRRNEVLIANDTACRSLLGALPLSTMAITGIEQLAQRAAEWINELQTQLAAARQRLPELETELALAREAARNIQENSAESIKALREAHFETQARIKELEAQNAQQSEQITASIANTNDAMEQWMKASAQVVEAEQTLKRGQFAMAQLEKEMEYQEHHTGLATKGWQRSRAQLAATEEALAQVQRESAALREERDEDGAHMRAIGDEINRAFTQLQVAFPDSPNNPTHLVGLAIHARDEINRLRAERDKLQERSAILTRQIDIKRDELRRADQDHNDAYTILREAFPQPSQINSLIGLARAAVEHTQELKRELHKTTRRAERAEHHWSETERRLEAARQVWANTKKAKATALVIQLKRDLEAAKKEVGTWKTGTDYMTAKCERLKREAKEREGELAVARKVCEAAVEWAAPGSAIVESAIDLKEAVRAYREQTNNQQPQGE
jgi:chromosome segregation ATPase